MKIKGIMVVEDIDCQACKGIGYEPGHEFKGLGIPYRHCPTCQGQQVRHRLMSLEDFAKLFTYGQTYRSLGSNLSPPDNEIRVRAPSYSPSGGEK